MIIAVTGGRDRTPTLAELERLARIIKETRASEVRHGACKRRKDARGRIIGSTDIEAAEYIQARGLASVSPWPADWTKYGDAAGPIRNRAMLDGRREGDLVPHGRVDLLVRFAGGRDTRDCSRAAAERSIQVVEIEPVAEPRIWNRHRSVPPGPALYIGGNAKDPSKSSPLANPYRLDRRPGESRHDAAVRVLAEYRSWLWPQVRDGGPALEVLESITVEHYLVCSCWPADCHGEVVVRAWRWVHGRE